MNLFVPASEVFPNSSNDFEAFKSLVSQLSRTDTLFWCTRLNLIISNPIVTDHLAKQRYGLEFLFTSEQIARIDQFALKHGGARRIAVFHRGQLLELIRWVCLYCQDQPEDGNTFTNPDVRRIFAQVLMIASELWSRRVFGDTFLHEESIDLARKRTLGSIRQALAETSFDVDPFRTLARGKAIIREELQQFYPEIEEDFQQRTELSIEDYYTCLIGLISHYWRPSQTSFNREHLVGLFNADSFLDAAPQVKTMFSKFIAIESQSVSDLQATFQQASINEYDFTPLRKKPILRANDGRAIIIDPIFYAEKASVGPLFHLLGEGVSREKVNQVFTDFGFAFEAYSTGILRRMYPKPVGLIDRLTHPLTGRNLNGTSVEISDACINDFSELVLFEIKGKWIQDKVVLSEDYEQFLEHLRERYGHGATQLAKAIKNLERGEWKPVEENLDAVKKVYPVLIARDLLIGAGTTPYFLASEFKNALEPDETYPNGDLRKGRFHVTPLIVITIDDLENLETSTRHFSLRDLLQDYSNLCGDRITSLHDFIATSKYSNMMRHSTHVASKAAEALEETIRIMSPENPIQPTGFENP